MRDEAEPEDREHLAPAPENATDRDDDAAREARIRQAAERALAEAEARRAAETPLKLPKELGGRENGPEAVRYGDWEKKGIAYDF